MEIKGNINGNGAFGNFPAENDLLRYAGNDAGEVNAHIHTPWSFSAFTSIEQAFTLAAQQGVDVLGINDFITTGGYAEFMEQAVRYRVFPLFNIEFITLLEDERISGLRVNDPDNPGRTYFCGKGLPFPDRHSGSFTQFLDRLVENENKRMEMMTLRLDDYLTEINPDLKLSWQWISSSLAKKLVRERHLAMAVRILMEEAFPRKEKRAEMYKKIFGGNPLHSETDNKIAIENEIRSRLLKKGGVAYIPEDPSTFPLLENVRDMIIEAGGIPCYPVLLDNPQGEFTEWENEKEKLARKLQERGIYAVEFIPSRNDAGILAEYARYFFKHGFLVLFGTEHNTPVMTPLRIFTRDGKELPEDLRQIGWKSACMVAAHQYLVSRGEEGLCDTDGKPKNHDRERYIHLGDAVIRFFRKQN